MAAPLPNLQVEPFDALSVTSTPEELRLRINSNLALTPETSGGYVRNVNMRGSAVLRQNSSRVMTVIPFGLARGRGRLIHYMHFREVKQNTYGMKRLRMFFRMLRVAGRIRAARRFAMFAVRVVVDVEAVPPNFNSLAMFREAGQAGWGIGQYQNITVRPFDNNVWPINIMESYAGRVQGGGQGETQT